MVFDITGLDVPGYDRFICQEFAGFAMRVGVFAGKFAVEFDVKIFEYEFCLL